MKRFRPNRREWMLLLFPVALLVLPQLNKFRSAGLGRSLNPLARIRDEQDRKQCLWQMKEFNMALDMYVMDNEGRFPPATTLKRSWVSAINPWSWNSGLVHLRCPANGTTGMPQYWFNSNLTEPGGRGVARAQIRLGAETFSMGDGDSSLAKANYTLDQAQWQPEAPYANLHSSGANYCFVDGHVKWLKSETVDERAFTLRSTKPIEKTSSRPTPAG